MSITPTVEHLDRHDREALDRSLVRGVAWTGGIKWATQIVTWFTTLLIARLLTPEDYGLVGMAAVYLGLLTMLNDAGLGTTIIAMRDLRGSRLAQMHSLAVLIGQGEIRDGLANRHRTGTNSRWRDHLLQKFHPTGLRGVKFKIVVRSNLNIVRVRRIFADHPCEFDCCTRLQSVQHLAIAD